jgi:hypothetical protein
LALIASSTLDLRFSPKAPLTRTSSPSADFNLALKTQVLTACTFGTILALSNSQGQVRILKISLVEGPRRCRLIVEGKLIAPWVAEFTTACEKSIGDLHGRELIVDLRNLTAISPEGQSVLLQLMREKVKFQCGIFMKELLRQLARKSRTREG